MKIEAIHVACYKYDLRFTRILVASIRRWYPEIPIYLIKDLLYGPFDTREFEKEWQVSCLPTESRRFGWGFAKLEPLFLPGRKRVLVLDSDIIFAGRVLEVLEACDSDFIVDHEDLPSSRIESNYFHLTALQKLDPNFVFPGFVFNTGQIVATTGLLRRQDFAPFVRWENPPELLQPDIFQFGEQGLLNYLLQKKAAVGEIFLSRLPFMETPKDSPASGERGSIVQEVQVDRLDESSPYRFLIHWCGLKKQRIGEMNRGDLLLHFERIYYAAIPWGRWKCIWRIISARAEEFLRSMLRGTILHRWWKRSTR